MTKRPPRQSGTPEQDGLARLRAAHPAGAALFAYVQSSTSAGTRPSTFRLPGLVPDAQYRVSAQSFGPLGTVQRRGPSWMDDGVLATGAALATIGLRPPILRPEEAALVVVERVGA